MTSNATTLENYSLCIAFATNTPNGRRLYKWHRVADYNPVALSILWPSLVEDDFPSPDDKRSHPNHLYNPLAAEEYDDRESDFYLFEWRPSPTDPGKTLSRKVDFSSVFPRGCEPKEVIFPKRVNGEYDLRNALSEGIPFEGKTTRVFYLVYERAESDGYLAVRCDSKNFDFSEGLIRLQPRLSNLRPSLSAPVVMLRNSDIIEARHPDVRGRAVYAEMEDQPEMSRFLLRPLTEYAAEYVKWFAQEQGKGLSRTDRQKIVSIIEEALQRPDYLEKYVSAKAPQREIQNLLEAIVAYARQEEDSVKMQIRDELLKDEGFVALCKEEVLRNSKEAIAQKQHDLKAVESSLGAAEKELADVQVKLRQAWDEHATVEEDTKEQQAELKRLVTQREELLEEYETDVALRLGLRAVASRQSMTTTASSCLVVSTGDSVTETRHVQSLAGALDKNMGSFGIRTVHGSTTEARKQLATGIASALTVTSFLAMPASLAHAVCDALSVAAYGRRATRIYVPTEYRDTQSLLEAINAAAGVVVLDNVIDAVNEGSLFAVLGQSVETPVVFSFVSHASASLIAKEAWNTMFFPPCEALVDLGYYARKDKFWIGDEKNEVRLRAEEVLDRLHELEDELSSESYPASALALPAAVLEACEELGGADFSMVAQHLALASVTEDDSNAVRKAAGNDAGLSQLAKRLGQDAR